MIVMGASLGGLKAVQTLLSGLPPSFPLPIVLALHRHKEGDDLLRHSLQRHTALRVIEVMDKEPIQPAHVYLGPPDYHLLVEQDCFSLSADEPVQFARPSIDVLFESAADISLTVPELLRPFYYRRSSAGVSLATRRCRRRRLRW